MAQIMIPTPLRKFAGNQPVQNVTSDTVRTAIHELVTAHPDLQRHLLDGQKNLRSFVRIFVGETDIRDLEGGETRVEGHTVISIVPAIAGGVSSRNNPEPHAGS